MRELNEVDKNLIYREISEEIDSNQLDKGLWIRSFAEANGNENQAKAKYINYRFDQLSGANDMFVYLVSNENLQGWVNLNFTKDSKNKLLETLKILDKKNSKFHIEASFRHPELSQNQNYLIQKEMLEKGIDQKLISDIIYYKSDLLHFINFFTKILGPPFSQSKDFNDLIIKNHLGKNRYLKLDKAIQFNSTNIIKFILDRSRELDIIPYDFYYDYYLNKIITSKEKIWKQ